MFNCNPLSNSNQLFNCNPLLIAATRVEELSLAYRPPTEEPSGIPAAWLMAIPFVVALIVLALHRYVRRRTLHVETPNDLLKELCFAHRIDATGRNLLALVAEKANLEAPALMFLAMTKYDAAVEAASHHVKFDRHDQATLKKLRRQLFTRSI